MEWGELGSGPGQFDLVHGVAVDRDHRVYVGDRTNNRIQIFTEDGEFIEEWPDVSDPVGVFIDENDGVWVISARLNRILKYNLAGELQYYFGAFGGTRGGFAGGLSRPHQLDVDQEGNLYIASWDGGWMDKPRAEARRRYEQAHRQIARALELSGLHCLKHEDSSCCCHPVGRMACGREPPRRDRHGPGAKPERCPWLPPR